MTRQSKPKQYQPFSSHKHPVSTETKIWRYLEFDKFAWLMEMSSLYHCRLDCFDDPFEGSVTALYAKKRAAGEINSYMPIPELEPINNYRLKLVRYASCWHANEEESPAMWKLYSHENRGVAVVSTFQQLNESVDVSDYKYGLLGPVEYFNYENDDMSLPMGLSGRPGYSKRKAFSHEREVRGMVEIEDRPKDPADIFNAEYIRKLAQKLPLGVQLPVDLNTLVSEIILSPKSGEWFYELVCSIAKRCSLDQVVKKSTLLSEPEY